MKETEKNIKKLLKGSEKSFLMATRNGTAVVGYTPDALTCFANLVNDLVKAVPKEMVEDAFRIGLMSPEEKIEELGRKLNEILDRMSNKDDEK